MDLKIHQAKDKLGCAREKETTLKNENLNLQKSLKDSSKKLVKKQRTFQNKKGKIRIFVRIKKEDGKSPVVVKKSKTHVAILSKPSAYSSKSRVDQRNFQFEKIFSEKSTQRDIFDEIDGLPEQLLSAENICIFAYGATGTGKTHSLLGSKSDPGLLFRCLDKLHEVIHDRRKNIGIRVRITEIYLEQVRNITDHFERRLNRSRYKGLRGASFETRFTPHPRHGHEDSNLQVDLDEHAVFQIASADSVRAREGLSEALGAAEGRAGECGQSHVCGLGRVREVRCETAEK